MRMISEAEKIDVLLMLAVSFERRFVEPETGENDRSAADLVEKLSGALDKKVYQALAGRAALLDGLPEADRENWRQQKLEKIRRRGRASRLDENINPSHIVEFLTREPYAVQLLILQNLPAELSRRVALYLDLKFNPGENPGAPVDDEIVQLVRRRFLSGFIALENIFEPDELDKFSPDAIEDFIRHLGLREIAIACRGIGSKETLAAFLNRFDEQDAREIALYLTELDKIRPAWVAQADALVRKSWSAELPPARVIRKIGFKLLAGVFGFRDETKIIYTGQKLSVRDVKNWQRTVSVSRKKYLAAGEDDRRQADKRRRLIERLAVKYAQTGKL